MMIKPTPSRAAIPLTPSPWLALAAAALSTLTACSPQRNGTFSGYVETEPVRVASPIGGRLVRLAVHRGDAVAHGAPLFALEQDSESAALDEAQARLKQAQAQASDLAKGARPDELAARHAALDQARAALVQSSSDLQRQRDLAAARFVSPAALTALEARRNADAARVQQLESELRVARLGARDDTRSAAAAQADAARAAVAQSQWRLTQKTVHAPLAARIDDTLYREGEWVPAGAPVISLLTPASTKVRFYVPEAQRAQLMPGTTVQVHCSGCGAPIAATVRYVATQAEYTPPVIYSQEERSKMVFMAEAWPQPADAPRLPPGLPVDVRLTPARAERR